MILNFYPATSPCPNLSKKLPWKSEKNSSSIADVIPLITNLKNLIPLSDEDTQEIREKKDAILKKLTNALVLLKMRICLP